MNITEANHDPRIISTGGYTYQQVLNRFGEFYFILVRVGGEIKKHRCPGAGCVCQSAAQWDELLKRANMKPFVAYSTAEEAVAASTTAGGEPTYVKDSPEMHQCLRDLCWEWDNRDEVQVGYVAEYWSSFRPDRTTRLWRVYAY